MASVQSNLNENSSATESKHQETPKTVIFSKDYTPHDYKIVHTTMWFKLDAFCTEVTSHLYVMKQSDKEGVSDLILNGNDLQLRDLYLTRSDGDPQRLLDEMNQFDISSHSTQLLPDSNAYSITPGLDGKGSLLRISGNLLPKAPNVLFKLTSQVTICPESNLQLSGLYKSESLLCTQCEPEGFRRITYFIDRPDNLSTFLVRLEGDAEKYPVLLCNGNVIGKGVFQESEVHQKKYNDAAQDGRMVKVTRTSSASTGYVIYEDRFPKPCYLFALVAGNMAAKRECFANGDNGEVELILWCEPHEKARLDWAMHSLKSAMDWDRETYNLCYDLNIFNIVAVPNFNAGAMENKSLNIFNSALLLCSAETSTDDDFIAIMSVVGHEYFHNWTGDRVTCRDWFQLTLKEGLTVYREQEFHASRWSHGVSRIHDVQTLRSTQFPEDSGPLSHPVRPDSYIAIDNFYTATVYEKGAEVVRMFETILGAEEFKKGFALYLKRHDGQAVTCEDFQKAMMDANDRPDLQAMERWYSTPGTPVVRVDNVGYDPEKKIFQFTLTQKSPSTPLLIPVRVGLVGRVSKKDIIPTKVVTLNSCEPQVFKLENIEEDCVLSILRGFSAPIRLEHQHQTNDMLTFLLAYDSDPFNQWEAGQILVSNIIMSLTEQITRGEKSFNVPSSLIEAYRHILQTTYEDLCFKALLLMLPDHNTLLDSIQGVCDPIALAQARDFVQYTLSKSLHTEFERIYKDLTASEPTTYKVEQEDVARRCLRNVCLAYLTVSNPFDTTVEKKKSSMAFSHFTTANNMTDSIGAMACLKNMDCDERRQALEIFHKKAAGNDTVLLKWFALQAMSNVPNLIETVKALQKHKDFKPTNANHIRALYGVFGRNPYNFHRPDGKGYEFYADCIIAVDQFNHQVASRLTNRFSQWKKFSTARQDLIKTQLRRILDSPNVSKECYEICIKTLGNA